MIAYHGTSLKRLPSILKDGLKRPYLAKRIQDAAFYAMGTAEFVDHSSVAILKVDVKDTKFLRFDYASWMDPPFTGPAEYKRKTEKQKKVREALKKSHPEWFKKRTHYVTYTQDPMELRIPEWAWEISWDGVGAVFYDGVIPPEDIIEWGQTW